MRVVGYVLAPQVHAASDSHYYHLQPVRFPWHELVRPTTRFEEDMHTCLESNSSNQVNDGDVVDPYQNTASEEGGKEAAEYEVNDDDYDDNDGNANECDVLIVYSITTSWLMAVAHMMLIMSVLRLHACSGKLRL